MNWLMFVRIGPDQTDHTCSTPKPTIASLPKVLIAQIAQNLINLLAQKSRQPIQL
jgi:hypothetical protein